MKTIDEYIKQYINLCLELYNYDLASNLIRNDNYDFKNSINLGKKINNLALKIIDLDIEKFIKLLDYDNIVIKENAAEYLYPLFPKKCLEIMNEYMNLMNKDVDKIKIKSKIDGLKRNDTFFIDLYKKIYNTNDISSLSREK